MSDDLEGLMRSASRVAGLQSAVHDALADLGEGPDEIADTLAEHGVTGRRYQPASCPVALWLQDAVVTDEDLAVRVDRQDVVVEAGDTKLRLPSPKPVALFVERFDSGEFPDLEGDSGRVMRLGGTGDFYTTTSDEPDTGEEDYGL